VRVLQFSRQGVLLRAEQAGVGHADDVEALVATEQLLDPRETLVDGAPAGGDEVDEDGQIVDAGVLFGAEGRLDALELPDRADTHPAHLGQMAADRRGLRADPGSDGGGDLLVDRCERAFAHLARR